MSDDLNREDRPGLEKDPQDWVTGDEPMTGAQASYLGTLGRQAGESISGDLTKAEASTKIDELRGKAGLSDGPRDNGPKADKSPDR
ncbi:MAG: DUF3072 domain-containing protein [Candidatus Limnocylindrales bacterium]